MSVEFTEQVAPESDDGQEPPAGQSSLAARVQKRRAELAQRDTVIIEVNGYEEFLAVEYSALPWQQTRKLVQRHQRVRDEGLQQLYVAADTLIRACERAYEVTEDGKRVPLNMGWGVALARHCGWEINRDDTTDRQAMLSYMFAGRDSWLMAHYGEYIQWLQGQRMESDEEADQDFARTQ